MSAPPKKSAEKPVKQKPIKKEDDGEGSSPEDIPKNPNIAPTKVVKAKKEKTEKPKGEKPIPSDVGKKSAAPVDKKTTSNANNNNNKDEDDKEEKDVEREIKVEYDRDEERLRLAVGNCRFYEQKFPEVDDVVVVEVKRIEQMGAYVVLKEYNDIEGMILLSELSRRRIRSINKLIRVGRLEVVVVLRVDKEKGYIDLSKRRVGEEDIIKAEERYNKAKAVHSILSHVAETTHQGLESLYTQIGWPLYKKSGHALDAFKEALVDKGKILSELKLEEQVTTELMKNIKHRLTPQPIKLRADIDVTCFKYEGIDAVKRALKKGEAVSTPDITIKIKLVAPPLYVLVTSALIKQHGIDLMNKAIEAIKEEILKAQGEIVIQAPPRAVQERDDDLEAKLKASAKEKQEGIQSDEDDTDEKDGDDDEDSEEEEEEEEK